MNPTSGALLAALLLTGCSLDYDKEQDVNPDDIPLMVFKDIKQSAVKDGQLVYTMESSSSEVYQAKREVRLKNLRFQEYDAGKPASTGSVGSVVVNTNTNDARLTGGLSARSADLGVSLEVEKSGALSWTNDDRILKTDANSGVTLRKDDGSTMSARTLTLNLGTNRLELEDGVQGTWTPETNDETAPASPETPPPPPASSAP